MNQFLAWLWQGAIVAGVTALVIRVVPGGAASKRHLIWWQALILILMLPLLSVLLPRVPTGVSTTLVGGVTPGPTLPMPPAWLLSSGAAIWLAVVIADLCRLAVSLRSLGSLVSQSTPIDRVRAARFTRWLDASRLGRAADLRVSEEIRGACLVGFRHPSILVSSKLVAALGDDALESIILHEYAHLERYDDWARLVQRIILAAVRWHPAVAWISRRIDLEREVACDQRVIARTGAPLVYARHLAEAAALTTRADGVFPALAPASSTTMPLLRMRVQRLVTIAAPPSRRFVVAVSACCGVGVCVAAVAAQSLPPIVTFAVRELPLAALVSTPLPQRFLRALPPGAQTVAKVHVSAADDAVAQPLARSSKRSPSNADTLVSPVARMTIPESVQQSASTELTSRPIAVLVTLPPVEPDQEQEQRDVNRLSLGDRTAAMGSAAARAATATGMTASRAGTSVGRFFKNGGLGIAKSF